MFSSMSSGAHLFGASGDGPTMAIAMGAARGLIIPVIPEAPSRIVEELRRIGSFAYAGGWEAMQASRPETTPAVILERGRTRKFLSASLFVLDVSGLAALTAKSCHRSVAATVALEVAGFASQALGTSGLCEMASERRILCTFFSHAAGDPELIATQVSKALVRALSLPDPTGLEIGPFLAILLADDDAERQLRAFIDGLSDS